MGAAGAVETFEDLKPAWQSLGESNPSLQVENLAS
jgi:hypothetical protein